MLQIFWKDSILLLKKKDRVAEWDDSLVAALHSLSFFHTCSGNQGYDRKAAIIQISRLIRVRLV